MAEDHPLLPEPPSPEHTLAADASKVEGIGTSMTVEKEERVSQENMPTETM